MNANLLSTQPARVAGFVLAVLMSAGVLGATVLGMVAQGSADTPPMIVMERVVVTGHAVN